MNKKVTLRSNVWLKMQHLNTYIYIYIFFLIKKSSFESSFRPSGPGSAASFKI